MLTNEQRFALANRMMSVIERLVTMKDGAPVSAEEGEPKSPTVERALREQEQLDKELTEFARNYWTNGPDDLLPEVATAAEAVATEEVEEFLAAEGGDE